MAEASGRPLAFPITRVAPLVGTDVVRTKVTGDTFNRFVLNADGSMEWGAGSGAADATLARFANSRMQLQGLGGGAQFDIMTATPQNRELYFSTNSSLRWIMRCDSGAESGSNAGSDFALLCRTDAGGAITAPIQITRATGGILFTTATGAISFAGGNVLPNVDNAISLGISDINRWTKLFLSSPGITKGSGTGYTLNSSGEVRRLTFKCTVDFTALAAAAVQANKTICTLPAKTRVVGVWMDTTTKYIGGAVATATLRLGSSVGGVEIMAAHDVFTAAVTKGLADADLGTSMTRAAAIQGGYMPSFTATTTVTAQLNVTGANTNALTQGSTTYYLECEVLP